MSHSVGGYVHATVIALSGHGVLIRGKSRSGKSTLAERLIAEALAAGQEAALVGDDRVRVSAEKARAVARPHPAIAGLIERRGEGIIPVHHVAAAPIQLVIDLVDDGDEPPIREGTEEVLPGIAVPKLILGRIRARNISLPLVLAALAK